MYICTKAITLSGNKYVPGDIINDGDIIPKRVGDLVAWGYITVSEAGKQPAKKEYKDVTVKDTKTETKEAVKPAETKPAEAKAETKEKAKKAVKEV